jgi:transcription initiation factor IIF auxiliary subunit
MAGRSSRGYAAMNSVAVEQMLPEHMRQRQQAIKHATKHRIIHKPIIFGTHAVYLGKKASEDKNHKWCCYVRGLNGEDISRFVSKVEFDLDKSFPEPNIVIHKPPF